MTAAIMTSAVTANVVLLRRVGPRALQTLGMQLGAGALVVGATMRGVRFGPEPLGEPAVA